MHLNAQILSHLLDKFAFPRLFTSLFPCSSQLNLNSSSLEISSLWYFKIAFSKRIAIHNHTGRLFFSNLFVAGPLLVVVYEERESNVLSFLINTLCSVSRLSTFLSKFIRENVIAFITTVFSCSVL